ncbi:hypothetical protein V1525DRAFT_418237 [Lipomyces kononenkoae]|uniref:Uncharacterized protein n=1 Tax=Lipomyces kononenkoae TaxID=34357 RepID=A0ACC3T7D7_LIPKO
MEQIPDDYYVTSNSFTKTVYRDVYPSVDPTSPALSQAGKIVVITGASRGIGKYVPIKIPGVLLAIAFAKAHAKGIVISARDTASLKGTVEEVRKVNTQVEVLPVALEITDEESVKNLFKHVKNKFATVDVLVSNAGVFSGEGLHIRTAPSSAWWRDFEVNVKGTMLVTKYFLQLLGTEKKGSVITITSAGGLSVFPIGISNYSIAKLANLQLSTYTAAENPNVTAVAFHPGIVMTDMVSESFKPFAKDTPQLAGGVVVWLATDAASFMNGRYMSTNWSVDEIVEKKDEILSKDLLKITLRGDFGTAKLQPSH